MAWRKRSKAANRPPPFRPAVLVHVQRVEVNALSRGQLDGAAGQRQGALRVASRFRQGDEFPGIVAAIVSQHSSETALVGMVHKLGVQISRSRGRRSGAHGLWD